MIPACTGIIWESGTTTAIPLRSTGKKARQINVRLSQAFGKHPGVILWHISNEYGGECYCELCQEAFRQWLKEKYRTLEALNHAWWTGFWSHTYTDWSQIEPPLPRGESHCHGLSLDW